jgi:DNA-binding NarL/FixJ family response regulator
MLRIAIDAMQPLLGEILESAIAAEPDMMIVGHANRGESMCLAAKRLRADVAIVGEHEAPSDEWMQLFRERPQLVLFNITNKGRTAVRHDSSSTDVIIEDVSPSKLIQAIRAAATEGKSNEGKKSGQAQP